MDKESSKSVEPGKNSDHKDIQMEMKDQVFDNKVLGTKKRLRQVKTEDNVQKQEINEDCLAKEQQTDRNLHTEREMVSSNGE